MSADSQAAAKTNLERCQRLAASPDFQWFMEAALTAPRKSAEATLKDTKTLKDAREIAAHVRGALETAETWLTRQSDIYERQSK